MTIKAVLFDLDNTLYDYDKTHKIAMKEVYKEFKKYVKINEEKFIKLFNISKAEIHKELAGTASAHNRILYFQRLIEKTKETLEAKIILKLNDVYWNTLLKNIDLMPGAIDVLKYCKKNNIKTAIVSDLTTRIQLEKIERLKINKYIDVLVTSEEAGSEKPHAIMFLLTLNKLNVMPQDAIMIGDNAIADIEGANYVKLNTVLLKHGNLSKTSNEGYQTPNATIDNITDLIKEIENFNLKKITEEGYTKYNCIFKKTKPVNKDKIKTLNKYRQKLYELKLIGAYENKVGYGNVSIKDKKNIIISGSTTGNYKKLNENHYSIITNYNIKKNQLECRGNIKASSESLTHAAIYECSPNIGAVIHIHNLKMWEKHKDKLPTTSEFATYGTPELAIEIQRLFYHDKFKEKQIAVLGGHKQGLIAYGKTIEEAYKIILEHVI